MTFDSLHNRTFLNFGLTGILLCAGMTEPVQAERVYHLKLDTNIFKTSMCKKIHPVQDIRIPVANHRDLILKVIPGQFIPEDPEAARKKSHSHYISIEDLTNGKVSNGFVAFDNQHAVIFHENSPKGTAYDQFLAEIAPKAQDPARLGLNTFLRLHPIFNAAINACRPYPSKVLYSTDDEFDKIETNRIRYRELAADYNRHPGPEAELFIPVKGNSNGFFDPRTNGRNQSYHVMNPLNFFVSDTDRSQILGPSLLRRNP